MGQRYRLAVTNRQVFESLAIPALERLVSE